MDRPTILLVGTLDTKAEELSYLHSLIQRDGKCSTKVLDVGWKSPERKDLSISEDAIIRPNLDQASEADSRGQLIQKVIEAGVPMVEKLVRAGDIHGIISAGGSCGTSIATAIMRRSCQVGFPKLMVSTVASGNVKHFIEDTDITMMYSVVDIAGLNSVLKEVLSNGAGAITGMSLAYANRLRARPLGKTGTTESKIKLAITMFGVTTPCVDKMRELLDERYEVYVFHATGAGGKAMERLIEEDQIDAVIDLTTTEIADELVGGVFSAGSQRLEAAAKRGIPVVLSVGATDMVNFGPMDTLPAACKDRNIVQHNPAVTLMRTNEEDCRKIGDFIAGKLKSSATEPERVKVILPVRGVSMLDYPDQAFYDVDADEALFRAIEEGLRGTAVDVRRVEHHVNDEAFASELVDEMQLLLRDVSSEHERK